MIRVTGYVVMGLACNLRQLAFNYTSILLTISNF